ncbi:hypothetical protein A1O3_08641 [Capronia epimyces CBS 606.96]|uniref:DNA-directed RNA polymerase RBP11-like dimerisation domain-containing protein n=1 Tax=Capronia epimyces CBS 606.96 TaxID=1182542 RepID=W9XP80_9EURO|nr:uncharacterized protein A1O3_08641 [Capronia epimyces CBS 606.96]EXJ79140.1 hypothetical protein A1O3_08641 [Capronia epimyces CBS 606.96]
MAEPGESASVPHSTTPPGSPPKHLYYGLFMKGETRLSTTPPGSPPKRLFSVNGAIPPPPSTTPPSTPPRRFSSVQDIKGKARDDTLDPTTGNTTANGNDAEQTASEAALAQAINDLNVANDNNAPDISDDIPSPERRGRSTVNQWSQHPSHKPYQYEGKNATNHHKTAQSNIPDRTEAFLLGPDEKRVEPSIDTRTPNTMMFIYNKEDHTLGNLLVDKLLKNSHVRFAAYRVPHPLFARFELRIQTDGEITPKEALIAASSEIIRDYEILKINFTREYELRKMVGSAAQNNGA